MMFWLFVSENWDFQMHIVYFFFKKIFLFILSFVYLTEWSFYLYFFLVQYTGTMNWINQFVGFAMLFWNLNSSGMLTKLLVNILR